MNCRIFLWRVFPWNFTDCSHALSHHLLGKGFWSAIQVGHVSFLHLARPPGSSNQTFFKMLTWFLNRIYQLAWSSDLTSSVLDAIGCCRKSCKSPAFLSMCCSVGGAICYRWWQCCWSSFLESKDLRLLSSFLTRVESGSSWCSIPAVLIGCFLIPCAWYYNPVHVRSLFRRQECTNTQKKNLFSCVLK